MKCMQLVGLVVGGVVWAVVAYAGELQTVQARATGTGVSQQQAIDKALVSAIQQVNGKVISEADIAASLDLSAHLKNDTQYLKSNAYLSVMQQATHGAVTGFQVDKAQQDATGDWTVSVTASIAKYVRSAAEDRIRIAIATPRTQAKIYDVFGSQASAASAAGLIADRLQTYLTETNKFTVLDRKYDAEAEAERDIAASGQASTEEYALVGQKLVADYVLVGTIDRLAFSIAVTKSHTGDHTYQEPQGDVAYTYRLISTASQQVAYAGSVTFTASDLVGANDAVPSKEQLLAHLADVLSRHVGAGVMQSLYPIRVLSADGTSLIVGAGEGMVRKGETYRVMSYGAALTDPDTKESLGRTESYCCAVRIDRVTPRLSYATLLPPTKGLESFAPDRYVLSEEVGGGKDAAARAKAAKAAVDKEKKKQQDDSNNTDW